MGSLGSITLFGIPNPQEIRLQFPRDSLPKPLEGAGSLLGPEDAGLPVVTQKVVPVVGLVHNIPMTVAANGGAPGRPCTKANDGFLEPWMEGISVARRLRGGLRWRGELRRGLACRGRGGRARCGPDRRRTGGRTGTFDR